VLLLRCRVLDSPLIDCCSSSLRPIADIAFCFLLLSEAVTGRSTAGASRNASSGMQSLMAQVRVIVSVFYCCDCVLPVAACLPLWPLRGVAICLESSHRVSPCSVRSQDKSAVTGGKNSSIRVGQAPGGECCSVIVVCLLFCIVLCWVAKFFLPSSCPLDSLLVRCVGLCSPSSPVFRPCSLCRSQLWQHHRLVNNQTRPAGAIIFLCLMFVF
jgi:hypothetical protein